MIYLIDIIDGANFNAKMCSTRAFASRNDAYDYAAKRVRDFREKLVASGETDEAFIEAIHSEMHEVEMNNGDF